MIKAFVFGKFMPFHKGHEAMINFALTKCDHLTILICCSDKENLSSRLRKKWIANTFADQKNLDVLVFNYRESEFPNTSVASTEVSAIWAEKFKELFPDYSLLITSEPYGEYVAGFMNIQHIPFDPERIIVPVSASKIREDLLSHWSFLPDKVKTDYIKKVVILGSESTGKTTLTNDLAKHFNASSVLEAGREVIKNSNEFTLEDLYCVVSEHANKIEKESIGQSPLLIIDTDVYITQSYTNFVFKTQLELSDEIYSLNKADLYLYLNNDVEFIQDGTRLSEKERNLLDQSHRETLKRFNIFYYEIKGDWNERFKKSVALIEQLIK